MTSLASDYIAGLDCYMDMIFDIQDPAMALQYSVTGLSVCTMYMYSLGQPRSGWSCIPGGGGMRHCQGHYKLALCSFFHDESSERRRRTMFSEILLHSHIITNIWKFLLRYKVRGLNVFILVLTPYRSYHLNIIFIVNFQRYRSDNFVYIWKNNVKICVQLSHNSKRL